jgi:hypothetical protein
MFQSAKKFNPRSLKKTRKTTKSLDMKAALSKKALATKKKCNLVRFLPKSGFTEIVEKLHGQVISYFSRVVETIWEHCLSK